VSENFKEILLLHCQVIGAQSHAIEKAITPFFSDWVTDLGGMPPGKFLK